MQMDFENQGPAFRSFRAPGWDLTATCTTNLPSRVKKDTKAKRILGVFEAMRLLAIPRILLKLPVFIERTAFTFAFHLKWSQCLLISDTTHQM